MASFSTKRTLGTMGGSLVRWLSLCAALISARADDALVGKKAPEWVAETWINSDPLKLHDLAGKVVLVRWWTAPGCPFCSATAPALNEFHGEYRAQGLEIVGLYHHKAPGPVDPNAVRRHTQRLGFEFPVAIDPEWRTLKSWWLNTGAQRWTSVTFLIDRRGVVRHIHPGGQYVKGDQDYAVLKSKIEELLAEK